MPMRLTSLIAVVLVSIGSVSVFLNNANGQDLKRAEQGTGSTTDYEMALDRLMPTKLPGRSAVKAPKWSLIIRVLPPFGQREECYRVVSEYDGSQSISLLLPVDGSIGSQLRDLRERFPADTVEQLATRIVVKSKEIDVKSSPRLASIVSRAERVSIPLILPDEMFSDGAVYQVWSSALWGNSLHVELSASGNRRGRSPSLVAWIEELAAELKGR